MHPTKARERKHTERDAPRLTCCPAVRSFVCLISLFPFFFFFGGFSIECGVEKQDGGSKKKERKDSVFVVVVLRASTRSKRNSSNEEGKGKGGGGGDGKTCELQHVLSIYSPSFIHAFLLFRSCSRSIEVVLIWCTGVFCGIRIELNPMQHTPPSFSADKRPLVCCCC
jgi:hypothetical protein